MTNYHLNDTTGRVNICRAKTPDSCPIKSDDGSNSFHSSDKAEVQKLAEERLSKQYGNMKNVKKERTKRSSIKDKYSQLIDSITDSQDTENVRIKNGESALDLINKRVDDINEAIRYADEIAPHKYDSKIALHTWLSKDLQKANDLIKKNIDDLKSGDRLKSLFNKEAKAEKINNINKLTEAFNRNETELLASKKKLSKLIVSSELAKEGYILNSNISSVQKIMSNKAIVKFVCDNCNKQGSSIISSNNYIASVGAKSSCDSCGTKIVLQISMAAK